MTAKIGAWLVYFAIVATLIFVGWREPLKYRFHSRAAINEIEHPATLPPQLLPITPKPVAAKRTFPGTTLDRTPRENPDR